MKAFILLLFFVGYCQCVSFYGVTDYFTNGNTTVTTAVVQIDPSTGQFTTLFENVAYPFMLSQLYGGDTAFDHKNNLMYYADNGNNNNFVYAVDVVGKKVVKSYCSQATEIFGVEYDESEGLLIISGLYGTSICLLVIPVLSDGPIATYNLTEIFKSEDFFGGGTYDPINQIYYNVYGATVNGKIIQTVAIVDFKTNTTDSKVVECGDDYLIFGLTADLANKRLISLGPAKSTSGEQAFITLDPSSFSCKVTNLGKLESVYILYNPTADMLYMLYNNDINYIGTYDIAKNKLSTPVQLESTIEAFAFGY